MEIAKTILEVAVLAFLLLVLFLDVTEKQH